MWRHLTLAGIAAGLAASPWAAAAVLVPVGTWDAIGAVAATGGVALLTRGEPSPTRMAALVLLAAASGLVVGIARVETIDAGAARAAPGKHLVVPGTVAAVPRRMQGELLVELETDRGRLLAQAGEPERELRVGSEVRVEGITAEPEPWRAAWLRRRGIALVLEGASIEPTGGVRGGIGGRVDAIRDRAEAALGRGMPEREEALARGFVLGQDDRIDPRTVDDFKRSGLAHLLAVSGQNVILLCLLAWPLLAIGGLTLRARLVALLALIALYVAVTGAGPSIQRAGVMGAAGLVAGLAGTPRSRWYALLLAAVITLGVSPLASGDVGWQLSFAATVGIVLWSARLASLLAGNARRGSARRAAMDGVAVTVAATAATAPLMAHHFESLSVAALPANLFALPAVAPAMWLGMLVGIAGQLPAIPVEPLNWLNSLLLGYVAQVARWLGEPGWASVELGLDGPIGLLLAYGGLIAIAELGLRAAGHRAGLAIRRVPAGSRRVRLALSALGIAVLLAGLAATSKGGAEGAPSEGLRVSVLDVGQGDSILLEPAGSAPVLVDAGPPGADVADSLRDRGIHSLAALIVTHDQSDHSGGAGEVLDSIDVKRLAYAALGPELVAHARTTGAELLALTEGSEIRVGAVRLAALWPPAGRLGDPVGDPNADALVLLIEWRHFSMLLAADAEAELVPLDPGAVDVLKVAHHGSDDVGLGPLLDRTMPELAVISVGEGNTYGHPTQEILAELSEHSVATLRTDTGGTIAIEADERGWRVVP